MDFGAKYFREDNRNSDFIERAVKSEPVNGLGQHTHYPDSPEENHQGFAVFPEGVNVVPDFRTGCPSRPATLQEPPQIELESRRLSLCRFC